MRSQSDNLAGRFPATPVLMAVTALAFSSALLIDVTVRGSLTLDTTLGPLLRVDRVSALIVFLVSLVLLLVQSYAVRYLQDESYRGRFHGLAAAATIGSAVCAMAAGPLVFALGWILSGTALVLLVGLDRRAVGAADAVRRVRGSELISGASMLIAAGILVASGIDDFASAWTETGSGNQILSDGATGAIAVLLLVATAARSAQLFAGRWLQAALSAPTPVSALMHAGIVNAGALVAIKFGAVYLSVSGPALVLFVLTACTVVVTTAAMITRPDVKGSLALSTRAQMGFMLLQCALGAFTGALFHLFSHGLYKAALFLGAGQAIDQHRARTEMPAAHPEGGAGRAVAQMAVAALVPLVALGGAVAVLMPSAFDQPAKLVLLLFVWSTAAQALWWWFRFRDPDPMGAAAAVAVVSAMSWGYVGGYAAFGRFLDPSLPEILQPAPAWLVAPLFVVLTASTCARWISEAGLATGHIHDIQRSRAFLALYGRSLAFGQPTRRGRWAALRIRTTGKVAT